MASNPIAFLLNIEDIMAIHERLIVDQESTTHGVLSPQNLAMCISAPNQGLFGYEPYDNLIKKGTKLAFEIVCLHPFVDGNKRTAFASVSIMFEMNGLSLIADSGEIISVMLAVAKGDMGFDGFLAFIEASTVCSKV